MRGQRIVGDCPTPWVTRASLEGAPYLLTLRLRLLHSLLQLLHVLPVLHQLLLRLRLGLFRHPCGGRRLAFQSCDRLFRLLHLRLLPQGPLAGEGGGMAQ